MQWRFEIRGVNPIPKERPRFSGHGYTPKRTREFENKLKAIIGNQLSEKSINVSEFNTLDLGIVVHYIRKTKHAADTDNLTKAVKDALQGVLWSNDKNIKGECSYLSHDSNLPGIVLVIMPFDEWLKVIPASQIAGKFL